MLIMCTAKYNFDPTTILMVIAVSMALGKVQVLHFVYCMMRHLFFTTLSNKLSKNLPMKFLFSTIHPTEGWVVCFLNIIFNSTKLMVVLNV